MTVSKESIESAVEDVRKYKIRVSELHPRMVAASVGIRNLSKFSNEFLWRIANSGDQKALTALYNKVKGVWLAKVPTDKSRMYTEDDWMQVAGEEFSLKWRKFNPDLGYKFNTWITRVVQNRWINTLRSLSSERQRVNVEATSETAYAEFSNIIVEHFTEYADAEMLQSFVGRFREYIADEVEADVLCVLDLKLWDGALDLESVAKLARKPVDFVNEALKEIRVHALDFWQIEKDMRYGYPIFS